MEPAGRSRPPAVPDFGGGAEDPVRSGPCYLESMRSLIDPGASLTRRRVVDFVRYATCTCS